MKLSRHAALSSVALFAAADAASGAAAPKPAKSAKDRVPSVLAGDVLPAGAIPMPAPKVRSNGSKSIYPFDSLEVGGSFGVKNKTAKDLTSVLSTQNRKKGAQTGTQEVRDPNTNAVVDTVPVYAAGKKYEAFDVNPKKDPQGASVRVFRRS